MSIHVDDALMVGMSETLEDIKEMINLKFNIQESGKVKNVIKWPEGIVNLGIITK